MVWPPRLSVNPALALSLWLGSRRDGSGFGNHATPTAMHWQATGGVDAVTPNDATGRLDVAHSTSLLLPSFTIHLHSPDGLVQSVDQWVMVKGSQIAYRLRVDRLRLSVGGVNSDFVGTYAGAKSITVTLESGNAPEFYTDGSPLGTGLAALTSVSDGAIMNLLGAGGSLGFKSSVSAYAVYPGALSAAEVAILDTACRGCITPRKQWPGSGIPGSALKWRANTQSARVSMDTEASGRLSNTDLEIITGSHELTESAAGRTITCVTDGRLRPMSGPVGADGWDTSVFEETGGVVLTKNAANFTIDMTAGDTFTALELTAP